MNVVRGNLKKAYAFIVKKWFLFFVILSYLFFAVYYSGPAMWDCQNTVNGIGDSTAGPIWKNTFMPQGPFGGVSKVTNYPIGEDLASPVDAIVSGQSILLWSTSKVVGPICSYNLTVNLGIIGSAIIMFFFVRSVLGRRFGWIAWLAGYLFAFSPYFQVKTTVHPGYAFQGLLLAALWAFLLLMKTKRVGMAVLLGVLIGICFYFDPYFSLLVGTLVAASGCAWLAVSMNRMFRIKSKKAIVKQDLIHQLKLMCIAAGVAIAMVLPIAVTGITQAGDIQKTVAGTRDNIQEMARACSNWPGEYLLPFPDSPLFKIFGSEQTSVRDSLYEFSDCGIAEDAVGVALVALVLIILFIIVASWEILQGRRNDLLVSSEYDSRLLLGSALMMVFLGIALALPPANILGVPTLSEVLISQTTIWRVLAREYVIVNMGIVIITSVAMAYFALHVKISRRWKAAVFVLIFIGAFIQYQTYRPFYGNSLTQFSYSEAPNVYYWLKSKSGVESIAEYPMEKATEANSLGYYLTMQTIHRKPMLNSALSSSAQDQMRSLLKNVSDPQVIPTLHALGVTHIVIHGVSVSDVEKISYVDIVYKGNHSPANKLPESPAVTKDTVFVLEINKDAPYNFNPLQIVDRVPKNGLIEKSAVDWAYEIPSGTAFSVNKIRTFDDRVKEGDRSVAVCLSVRTSLDAGNTALLMSTGDTKVILGLINGQYREYRISLNDQDNIMLHTASGENMRVTKIGCRE